MKYKAFISYSHSEDKHFSPVLQHSLETFAKKWNKTRRIRIFRDETSLAMTSSLWSSIEAALEESEYFIYLASPKAAESKWVAKEIEWWLANKDPSKLLIALTDGEVVWNDKSKSFDKELSTAIPSALHGALLDESLYLDFRWIKKSDIAITSDNPKFQDQVVTVLSTLLSEDKDELIGYHVTQRKKLKHILWSISSIFLLLFIASLVAGYTAYLQKGIAETRKQESTKNLKEANYNLAKVFEGKALQLISQKILSGASDSEEIEHHKLKEAWLYALEAATKDIPENRVAITPATLGRLSALRKQDISPKRKPPLPWDWNYQMLLSIAYSPDGKIIASGSNHKTILLWSTLSGEILKTLHGHTGWVRSVTYSPDGKLIASGSDDSTVRLWDATSGESLKTLQGHTDSVESVAYSPDGKFIASGSADRTIRLWDVHTGETLKTLQGHIGRVKSVTYSPDGKIIASGSTDRTIRLWDVHTGETLKTLQGHKQGIASMAYSPNGEIIASASSA